MRISPVLLLLSVLVLTGSTAIANDDRPVSPQPAIASPVPAPLTIESLAGTYKAVIDEKVLETLSRKAKGFSRNNVPLKTIEVKIHEAFDQLTMTINANGTYEVRMGEETQRGSFKIEGSKLIFTDDPAKPISASVSQCNECSECCTFTLNVSPDRRTLLLDEPHPSRTVIGYVKQ